MKKLLAKIRKILHDRRTRRFLTRFVSGIAAIVVFITTYALVLPAITMEKEANCGIEAHQHDDSCYTEELICDIPESEGHHHDESCYRTKLNLICETAEHEHSVENGCYDDEGNLICERKEHRHGDECYEEVKELTCEIPESDGHQHSEECYEKILTCGREVHVHSISCYEEEPVSDTAVAASTNSAAAATTSAGSVSSAGMTLLFEDKADLAADNPAPVDNADTPDNDTVIDNDDIADNGGTGATASSTTADQYIPPLDAIDFSAVLNNHTGIYYHSVADGETVEDSSVIPAEEWNRIPNNTDHMDDMDDIELGTNDLLRVYLSYTIPAGSLNTTNPTARYRLPSNLHLTDPQVKAINENANGIAGQYIDMSTLEIKDPDKYNASLGLEAVEGTRRPDESVEDYLIDQAKKTGTDAADATEYISAIVRVENVYDTDGVYGDKGAYLGQDLIFTFTPYSIEKNQHEYDSDGQPTKAGEKIKGWLTLDLNMGQVDFDNNAVDKEDSLTEKSDGEAGNTQNQIVTIKHTKRTAEIVFVEEGMDEKDNKIDQISTSLTMAEETVANVQDGGALEDDEKVSEPADQIIMPAMSFNDSIKVSTGRPVGIDKDAEGTLAEAAESLPEEAKVSVRVEADEGTFPAGTTMVLSAVDQSSIDALAETLAETVEKEDSSDTDASGSKADDEKEESDNTEDKEKNQKEGQKNSNTKTYGFQAVDITFLDKDGNEIEPLKPVRVALTSALVEQAREKVEDSAIAAPVVVHVDNDGNAEQMDLVSPEEVEPAKGRNEEELIGEAEQPVESDKAGNADEGADAAPDNSTDNKDTAAVEENGENAGTTEFTADSFSVYAIVYTVELYTNVITDSGETYRISVTYDETSGIPQDAELKVKEIKEGDKGYKDYYTEAVKAASESSSDSSDAHDDASNKEGKRVNPDKTYARFFDIEIWANGEKIEPTGDVSVSIRLLDLPETDDGNVIKIVHFDQDDIEIIPHTAAADHAESVDTTKEQNDEQAKNNAPGGMEFNFTASSFSVYSVVSYTVDFYWEVNGKLYQFSLSGGGFVSFTKLMEILNVVENDNQNETGDHSVPVQDAKEKTSLSLDDIQVREETRDFVSNVEKLEFSSPKLLSVSKAEEKTTVGAIKDSLGLECKYSAELTEEDIAKIDATEVESGDWALISLQPFTTEETLAVTMKNGEMFAIRITDSVSGDPLGLDGKPFVITCENKDRSLKAAAYSARPGTMQAQYPSSDSINVWTFYYDQEAFGGSGGYYIGSTNASTGVTSYLNVTNGNMSLTENRVLPEDAAEGTLAASPFMVVYDQDAMRYRIAADSTGSGSFLTFGYSGSSASQWFYINNEPSTDNLLHLQNPANPSGAPGTIGTWDIKGDGIVLKLFDYTGKIAERWGNGYRDTDKEIDSDWGPGDYTDFFNTFHNADLNTLRQGSGINKNHSLLFSGSGITAAAEPFNSFTGKRRDEVQGDTRPNYYTGKVFQDIVEYNLDGNYMPILQSDKRISGTVEASNGGSLAYLFNDSYVDGKTVYKGNVDSRTGKEGLKGLLRKDEDGYYYYDSEQNYAKLEGDEIILYSDTYYKNDGTNPNSDVKTKKIGLFPFDEYDSTAMEEKTPNGGTYQHQFGMTLSSEFIYPEGGVLPDTGKPMSFDFSGDDDVWVFVDGVLVLDLGGVHQPINGRINFMPDSNGKMNVTVTEFDNFGVEYVSTEKSSDVDALFQRANKTFNKTPYSQHRIDFFYLERGGCDSNCKIKFNLMMMTQVEVAKQINGLTPAERQKYLDQNYDFNFEMGVKHTDQGLNMDSTENSYWSNPAWRENFSTYQTAEHSTSNKNYTTYTKKNGQKTDGVAINDGQFTLKDGDSMTVTHMPSSDVFYVSEQDNEVMNLFEVPHAERLYKHESEENKREDELSLHHANSKGNGHVMSDETQAYKAAETERVTYTNTIKEKNLDVVKVWEDSLAPDDHAPVQFKLKATVEGADYGNSINAQRTERVNGLTTTYTENVYVSGGKNYTLSKNNGWRVSFEHLPARTVDNKDIIYSVIENSVPNGYSVRYEQPADSGLVYLDLFKFWPDGNANHDGSNAEKPVEEITAYVVRNDGKYVIASLDRNGEYVYENITDDIQIATPIRLTSKTQLSNLSTNDQEAMFDYAARVNNVPRVGGTEEEPLTYTYSWEEPIDQVANTTGLVMFTRPEDEAKIINAKGKINIEKEWLDENGNKLEEHPEQIKYTVYRLRHDHEWAVYDKDTKQWDYSQKANGEGWFEVRKADTATGTPGLEERRCRFDSCGHYSETREIVSAPCTTHSWGSWTVVKEPTCTENGTESHKCSKCGVVETRDTSKLGHRYREEVTTPVSCEHDGLTTHICERCGDSYTETVTAIGHDWGPWVRNGNIETSTCKNNPEHKQTRNVNNTYPGTTDLYLVDKDNVWPTWGPNEDRNTQKSVSPSGIFKSGNDYYVIYASGNPNGHQWSNTPTEITNYSIKVNGQNPKRLSDIYPDGTLWLQTNAVPKGTVVTDGNGNYWVRLQTEGWSGPPKEYNDSSNDVFWYKIPEYSSLPNNNAGKMSMPKLNGRKLAARPGGGQLRTAMPNRGVPAKTNLTEAALLSALNLTGLGIKNPDTGDTLTNYLNQQILATSEGGDTQVEGNDNLWRQHHDVEIYDENGSEYRYYIVENDPAVGGDYKVTYAGQDQGLVNGGTTKITNQIPKYDIEILKVIENTTTPIAGASFTIQKVDVAHITASTVVYEGDASPGDPESTGDDGKTGFKDLTPGIYEIFESDPPDGYVITGDAKFYVKVDSLGVHLLVKKVQNERVTFEGANTSRVGNVTLSTTDTAIIFTVENTPGTELPAAGGSGTLLYSVLGAILIVFAGAALVVRMKRDRFCISDTFW